MNTMRHAVQAAMVWCAFTLAASISWANVQLPALFTNNMVLQRSIPIPVWGIATPGEEITITLGETNELRTAKTTAGPDGAWRTELPKTEAGGPYDLKISGKNTITLHNVLVGDVWFCSGQSNMEFLLQSASTATVAIREAALPKLRLFTVPYATAEVPLQDISHPRGPIGWHVSNPNDAAVFSAVAFFFGRQLLHDHDVPIGLIHASWGGTPAEAWTSRVGLETNPALKPIMERVDKSIDKWIADLDKYDQDFPAWVATVKKARAASQLMPPMPAAPVSPMASQYNPTVLFNAMVAPVTMYGIKGVIWYQGEANAGQSEQYRTLFPTLITDWRKHWNEGDFPFLFVQLANFGATHPQPTESAWAGLREAQLMTLSLPKTGMAVIIDIGTGNNIHPPNKEDVGKRLALAARAVAYEENLVYSGPLYESMQVDGNKIVLKFKHVGDGLVAGSVSGKDKLQGFSIAGADHKFHWANAVIEGETVVVESDQVAAPGAVRYDWDDNPTGNLFNKEGLPASPFRTDMPAAPKLP